MPAKLERICIWRFSQPCACWWPRTVRCYDICRQRNDQIRVMYMYRGPLYTGLEIKVLGNCSELLALRLSRNGCQKFSWYIIWHKIQMPFCGYWLVGVYGVFCVRRLTHLPLDKMAAILQTRFWNAFAWTKKYISNSLKFFSYGSNWKLARIGSGNGWAPNKRPKLTQFNDAYMRH